MVTKGKPLTACVIKHAISGFFLLLLSTVQGTKYVIMLQPTAVWDEMSVKAAFHLLIKKLQNYPEDYFMTCGGFTPQLITCLIQSVLVSSGSTDIGQDRGRSISLSSGESNYALWWIQKNTENGASSIKVWLNMIYTTARREICLFVFTEALGSFTPTCEKWEQKQKCRIDLFNIKETPGCSGLVHLFWMFIFVCCVVLWFTWASHYDAGDTDTPVNWTVSGNAIC